MSQISVNITDFEDTLKRIPVKGGKLFPLEAPRPKIGYSAQHVAWLTGASIV